MTERRALLIALGYSAILSRVYAAQEPAARIFRIGLLSAESASDQSESARVSALRKGLRDLGYVEGKNYNLVSRWAQGKYDRLPVLAAELVQSQCDLIVAMGIKATTAAYAATKVIPIVVPATGSDLVALGMASSLAHPGRNVTGSAAFGVELMEKRLQILKEAIPNARKIGIILNPANPQDASYKAQMDSAAKFLKLAVMSIPIANVQEIQKRLGGLSKLEIDFVVVSEDTLFTSNSSKIAELLLQKRMPSIGGKEHAEAGGLIGYGVNRVEMFQRIAVYVDKILKGEKPGNLPIDRAIRFEFAVNAKVAKALGISIPPTIMVQANKVIE